MNPVSRQKRGEARAALGWQGISASVPAEWTLSALGGEFKSGYLRLDDADQPRLEVKWSTGMTSLGRALDKYLATLRKGRREMLVEADSHLLGQRAKPKKELRCFHWQDRRAQAWGAIWNCEVCKRSVVAQVLGTPSENLAPLAREVLASIEDHALEGELTWALYGFSCRVPVGYSLDKPKLMSGYLELLFQQGHARLKIARYGLLDVLLRDRKVRDWLELENIRRRDVIWDSSDLEIQGHPGAELRGRRRRLGDIVRRAIESFLRLHPANNFALQAWGCPEANRLYLVESLHHGEPEVLRRVVGSIQCH